MFNLNGMLFLLGGLPARVGEKISSFYFSEFPDRCRAVDIFKLFGCVGEIVEVVIPPRCNRFGKRFGFARFKEVKDERMLAVKLDNIQIDGRKIHANQPRFNRQGGKEEPVILQNRDGGRRETVPVRINWWVDSNRSFAAIVQGKEEENGNLNHKAIFSYSSQQVLRDRWRKAFIGEVIFAGDSYNIQTHLEIDGFFSIKDHPLGANLCLLEEMEEGIIQELIDEGEWWWKQWFKSIRPLKSRDVDSEQVVWVRVYGVPCHVWGTEFFETLANQLGSFICVDDNTVSGDNMDIARVMIRVPSNFVLSNFMEVVIDGEAENLGSGEEEDDEYVDASYPSDNEVEIGDRKSDGVGQNLHGSPREDTGYHCLQ
ncbi:uncharacterized protein LOC131636584 [Vicia villosa]|uniref:uncharacterized protein LOC131636584 n=1 Tax=Vicia villosa TaxID=3911 RepID=UPI00273BA089|nr:uncharacterized protein LOC131636584 [Vicia villosa]